MPNYTEQDFANNVNYLAETKNNRAMPIEALIPSKKKAASL